MNWTLQDEGETFSGKPNGHFRIRRDDGLSVLVTAFSPLATSAENRKAARLAAHDIAALLNEHYTWVYLADKPD